MIIKVKSGQSIQEAIDKAKDGDTVEVPPGNYPEQLNVPPEIKVES